MSEKILVFDLETTGVNHWENGIHQISGVILIDGEAKEKMNYDVKPFPEAVIVEEALEVAGRTLQDLEEYQEMREVYDDIISNLDKYVDRYNKRDKLHLMGYNNSSFDNQFFRAFFDHNNDKYFGSWFWSDCIDVMVIASNFLRNIRHTMPNFKLSTVATQMGIKVDDEKLHDAFYDLQLTYMIWDRIEKKKNQ